MNSQLEKLRSYATGDQTESLEIRLFRLLCLTVALLCLFLIFPTGILEGLPAAFDLIILIFSLLLLYFHRASCHGKHYVKSFYFLTILVLNLSWFMVGGTLGSLGYYFFAALLFPLTFFRGPTRWIMFLVLVADNSVLPIVEYFFPSLVTPFTTPHDRLIDLVTGLPFSCVAFALVFWVIISSYDRESSRVLNEIAERTRAEHELQKAHDDLEVRVRQRTEELEATVEKLKIEIAEREHAETTVLRLNRLYTVLSETNKAIVRADDRESLFYDFCRIAVKNGGFLLSWIGLVDEVSGQVITVAAGGATEYLNNIRITACEEPEGEGPTGITIRRGTLYICNDFQNDPCTRPWHEKGRSYGICASAAVALKENNRVIGALTLYAGEKNFFDRQHIELLVQMGADISYALDNLALEAKRRETERALSEETIMRLRAIESLREKEQMLIHQSRQAAMGEMIGNIAHQWRQPLNFLGLKVQQLLLFYDMGGFSRDFLEKNVSSSIECIQHMSRTIDDFRNYFKPDKEKGNFSVSEAIAHTLALIEDSFKHQNICIAVNVTNDPVINGYRNEFAQVVLNILNNARDVLTERETEDPKVTITICSEGEKAVVSITDNAGGIPEEIREKIFEPYFTTKGPQLGTGVGLFMSKTIIEKNMGGNLTASNIADGAEFRIEV